MFSEKRLIQRLDFINFADFLYATENFATAASDTTGNGNKNSNSTNDENNVSPSKDFTLIIFAITLCPKMTVESRLTFFTITHDVLHFIFDIVKTFKIENIFRSHFTMFEKVDLDLPENGLALTEKAQKIKDKTVKYFIVTVFSTTYVVSQIIVDKCLSHFRPRNEINSGFYANDEHFVFQRKYLFVFQSFKIGFQKHFKSNFGGFLVIFYLRLQALQQQQTIQLTMLTTMAVTPAMRTTNAQVWTLHWLFSHPWKK